MDIDPARVDRFLGDPKIPKADKDALVAAIRARPRTATITAPDGRTATLTIPAGASDELIREKALEAKARMLSLSQVRQETKDQPGPLRATAGVGHAVADTARAAFATPERGQTVGAMTGGALGLLGGPELSPATAALGAAAGRALGGERTPGAI